MWSGNKNALDRNLRLSSNFGKSYLWKMSLAYQQNWWSKEKVIQILELEGEEAWLIYIIENQT